MNIQARVNALSLRSKLALGMALCALIVAALAVFALQHYNRTLPPLSGVLLSELSEERSNEFSTVIRKYAAISQSLADDSLNQLNLGSFSINQSADLRRNIQNAFGLVRSTEPTIQQIRFVSAQGQTLISVPTSTNSGDETGEAYFNFFKANQDQNTTYISNIRAGVIPTADFVSVVNKGGQSSGYIVVNVNFSVIGKSDRDANSLYNALRTDDSDAGKVSFYILDNERHMLNTSGAPTGAVATTDAAIKTVLDNLPTDSERSLQYTSPLSGVLVTGIVAPIDNTPFYLVTEIPQDQIVETTEGSQFSIPVLGALAFAVILIGLIGLGLDSLLVRPTEQLLNAVENADTQNTPVPPIADSTSADEITRLHSVLNNLKSRAQQSTQDIEATIAQRTKNLESARAVGHLITQARGIEDLLDQTVKGIERYFTKCQSAQIYLLDDKAEFAILRASSIKEGGLASGSRRLAVSEANFIGHTILSGQAQVALDARDNTYHELLPEMRAELSVPIYADGKIVGLLDLQSQDSTAFSESDIALFSSVAEQFGAALGNLQAVQSLQERLQESEAFTRQLMGETWRRYVDSAANKVSTSEWSELQRQAVNTGELVESVMPDSVTFAIPVTLREEVIGAVEWDIPRSSYNENTRLLARELAARLAVSADNARLFEQSQRIAQRERLVNNIASKLIQQTDVTEILKVAVREVGQALRVPQTAIRLAASSSSNSDSEEV